MEGIDLPADSMNATLLRIRPETARGFPVSPDLGLAYLVKALDRAGHRAQYLDGLLDPIAPDDLARRQPPGEPWLCGIKLYSHQIGLVRAYARRLKQRRPDVVVVVGGPHPSSVGAAVFDALPEADFAVAGEGEIGLPALAGALLDPASGWEETVPGLIFRAGSEVRANAPAFVENLDDLDRAPWESLPVRRYLEFKTPIRNAALIPFLTSRGCPHRCAYCAGHRLSGHRVRYRATTRVVDEIEFLVREYGVESVTVQDDNFALRADRVDAFCDELIRRALPVRWDCLSTGVRVETLTPELLAKMERSGCHAVSIAVESANQDVLDDMRKAARLEVIAEKIRLIKRTTRMTVASYNILGYPTETRRSVANTIRFARRSGVDYALFFLFTPLPGTEITERLQRERRLGPIQWESFRYDVPHLPLRDLSLRGLKWMKVWAYLSFYLRPRTLLRVVRDTAGGTQRRDLAQRLRAALARDPARPRP